MKISKKYELWVGDDFIYDISDKDEAITEARKQYKEWGDKCEVIIDEIIHYHIENLKDLERISK